jgi:hypothetical protein
MMKQVRKEVTQSEKLKRWRSGKIDTAGEA